MMINIVGTDPSLKNWGFVLARYNTDTQSIFIEKGDVISHKPNKQHRQNTQDLATASYLYNHLIAYLPTDIICAEVPHGSQSSRAMVSYGVCIGILGSLLHTTPNLVQVSAREVKLTVGSPNASKEEVIEWVKSKHSEVLSWLPSAKSKAEHICDAIVTIHAATQTKQFKDLINEINHQCK